MATLDYERPSDRPPSRWLAHAANATALYPLLLLASLYGQWLLSWFILGHPPRRYLDYPMHIGGARWMHYITTLLLIGFFPAACAAVASNILYAIHYPPRTFLFLLRTASVVTLWVGSVMLLRVDPGSIFDWWID